MKVIMAKDSAFILLRLRRNFPGLAVRETTLKDGDFPLRPSQSYELNRGRQCLYLFYFFGSSLFPMGERNDS